MKRKPEKNYRLPKYAAGLAAMMLAGSMTGCTDPADSEVQIDGGMDVPEETRYVELSGDVAPEEACTIAGTDETTATSDASPTTPVSTQEVALAGDIAME